tara:strand:- start:520 stop:723 length:204 start_codon:yes stop_codon:yes gene_type:complete
MMGITYSNFFGEGRYHDRSAQILKHEGKWYVELQGGNYSSGGKVIEIGSEQQGEDIAEDFCLGFRDN